MIDLKILEKIKHNFNWNLWREHYNNLSFNDKKIIIDYWVLRLSPKRTSDIKFFNKAFRYLYNNDINLSRKRVAELGSDDGWLAYNCMKVFNFQEWKGYDISRKRSKNPLPKAIKLGFTPIELNSQFWDQKISDFDIFVSGHTLEHISNNHCLKLLNFVCNRAKIIIIEVPISDNWHDYGGAHLSTISREKINSFIINKGFHMKDFSQKTSPLKGLYTKNS